MRATGVLVPAMLLALGSCGREALPEPAAGFSPSPAPAPATPAADPASAIAAMLAQARYAKVYAVGREGGDVRVGVGRYVVPYGAREREGRIDHARLAEVLAHETVELRCLCTAEPERLLILRDQWRQVVGALALAHNHNAVLFIGADGTVLAERRFQRVQRDADAALFVTATPTLDLGRVVACVVE